MTKRKLLDVTPIKDDGYIYYKFSSLAPKSLYGDNLSSEEYENGHLDHIIGDYEEEGYEIIEAQCECHNDSSILAEFTARKKEANNDKI